MAKRLTCIVRASVPKGMSAAHFRRLIRDQLSPVVYLSIADQMEADTNTGVIRPKVGAASKGAR